MFLFVCVVGFAICFMHIFALFVVGIHCFLDADIAFMEFIDSVLKQSSLFRRFTVLKNSYMIRISPEIFALAGSD